MTLAILLALQAHAQQFPVRGYPADALPQPSVMALWRDPMSYLWLGTQDGVVRYDGTRFVAYGTNEGLRNGYINAMTGDESGRLWVGTDDGVAFWNGDGFTPIGEAEGLPGRRVTQLVTNAGHVVVATDAGVFQVDVVPGERASVLPIDVGPLGGTRVTDVEVGKHGELLVCTDVDGLRVVARGSVTLVDAAIGMPAGRCGPIVDIGGEYIVGTSNGIARWDGGKVTRWPDLASTDVRGLALDESTGALYVSGADGWLLRVSHPSADVPEPAEPIGNGPSEPVSRLLLDHHGILWGATIGSGLVRLDTATGELATVDTRHGLDGNDIKAMLEDTEGNLWVGTGVGLYKLRGTALVTYRESDGLPNPTVWAIARMPGEHGPLLVGTDGGVAMYSNGAFRTVFASEVRSIAALDDQTAVVANRDGLWALNIALDPLSPGSLDLAAVVQSPMGSVPGLPASSGPVALAVVDGTLYVGSETAVSRLENGSFRTIRLPGQTGPERIWSLSKGKDGRLWVGSERGIVRIDRDGNAVRYTTKDGLLADAVQSVYEDKNGVLWFAYDSSIGVGALDVSGNAPSVRHFTSKDGMPSDYAYFVGADLSGFAWFGTSKGVSRWDGNALSTYTVDDGLAWNDCDHNAFFADADGSAWFGTGKGLTHFRPDQDLGKIAPVAPPVVIGTATLGGVPIASGAVAPWEYRNFAAEWSALSFVSEDRTLFRHRLVGWDEAFSAWSPKREATYTNLPPGDYSLEVEARTKDGVVSSAPGSVDFRIDPHWTDTTWARVAGVLGLVGIGGLVVGARVLQVRRQNEALEKLVEQRTRELARQKDAADAARSQADENRKRSETTATELDAANRRLVEIDRLKNKVFEDVSHEFKTPLSMLVGPLEVMLSGRYGPVPAELHTPLRLMERSARQLLRQVDQILEIRRLGATEHTPRFEPVHLDQYLAPIAAAVDDLCQARGLKFELVVTAEDPRVYVDAERFDRIPLNLLSNAVKYTEQGGTVRLLLHDTPEAVELVVQDTGAGIPVDELPALFQRWRRGGVGLVTGGQGIGLALVKELVDAHRGTIEVSSEPQIGSTFRVRLRKGTDHLSSAQLAVGASLEPVPSGARIRAELDGVPRGGSEPAEVEDSIAPVPVDSASAMCSVVLRAAAEQDGVDIGFVDLEVKGGEVRIVGESPAGADTVRWDGIRLAIEGLPARWTLGLSAAAWEAAAHPSPTDRRAAVRVRGMALPCTVAGFGERRPATIVDISPTGLGLDGVSDVTVGAEIEVDADKGRLAGVPMRGKVAWAEGGRVGVALDRPPTALDDLWRGHLHGVMVRMARLGGRVLLVEDSVEMRRFLTWILERSGLTVAAVQDVGEALVWVENNPPPDLAIVDWMLPGGATGPELVERWRMEWGLVEVPVLLLTAKGQASAEEGLRHGANDHLSKPFTEAELILRLRNLLR